jgi:site-specific recombinase XerD
MDEISPLKQRRAQTGARRRANALSGDLLTNPEWAEYAAELDELFDAYCGWRRDHHDELRATGQRVTRADLPWRASSEEVYWNMWNAFTIRLIAHVTRLEDLNQGFLQSYLDHLAQRDDTNRATVGELNARYARRLLALVDRLIRFDAQRRGIDANPVVKEFLGEPEQAVLREANRREFDDIPAFLEKADRERLKQMLMLPVGSPARDDGAASTWRDVRDNASVGVQLGAGLAPGEVRALRLENVRGDLRHGYLLEVKANGNLQLRTTGLVDWARASMAAWLKLRNSLPALQSCPYVFCTDEGKQWSKNKVVQAASAVFKRAKLKADYGAYQLRHSFVLAARNDGIEWPKIAAALGITNTELWSRRYEAALTAIRSRGK